ncbi:MAG: sensor histidine kinase, partial [Chitinophagia bacterium]|nr:sensor histidine kinase [Chitinophagia bacterium]
NRLEQISQSSKRLIHIINQLLSLSKTQPEATHASNFQKMDLVNLTKKTMEDLFPLADLKKIDLGYEGSLKEALIEGDEKKLYDLIHNLVENAIKYTPNSGKVNVAIDNKNNKVSGLRLSKKLPICMRQPLKLIVVMKNQAHAFMFTLIVSMLRLLNKAFGFY